MTDEEKLEKLKKLADAMYYAAFNLTTDASLLRKAMDEYRQFIILEYHKEEPVSERFAFKAIPRLLEMIEPTDRAKAYIAKLADALESEGYSTDANIVRESLKIMNGEKVAMATMDEEPVSEDLGDYINELSKKFPEVSFAKLSRIAVRAAKWQKTNLWKPADGDDLPEYDREVVVFTQNFPDDAGIMSVAIGHRPNPNGWDGKSVTTGKVEHYTPKTYGKGDWNMPDVVLWLDLDIPKIEED